jgi:nicotinamidase/pyrazinamidase
MKTTKKVLVVVDVQNDFLPGGPLAVLEGDQVIPAIQKLMEDIDFDQIVMTQDWHPADHISFAANNGKQPFEAIETDYGTQVMWPTHCVQGTKGAEIADGIDTTKADLIVRKGMNPKADSYSAVYEANGTPTAYEGQVRQLLEDGNVEVYFTGLATDYCVNFTIQGFLKIAKEVDPRNLHKIRLLLVENAVRGIDLAGIKAVKKELDRQGVELVHKL